MALSCTSFRIIAVLVIPWKQPSSGLLKLCGLYLCVMATLIATVVLFNIFSTSRKHFAFQAILSHRAITSTNVDGTASQTTVPGYHTVSMTAWLGRISSRCPLGDHNYSMCPLSFLATLIPVCVPYLRGEVLGTGVFVCKPDGWFFHLFPCPACCSVVGPA